MSHDAEGQESDLVVVAADALLAWWITNSDSDEMRAWWATSDASETATAAAEVVVDALKTSSGGTMYDAATERAIAKDMLALSARAEAAEAEAEGLREVVASWQNLHENERARADRLQDELDTALDDERDPYVQGLRTRAEVAEAEVARLHRDLHPL